MKPERWRQVDQLFQAALERAPEDRSAFINEACGDDDSLRREVEALLAADGEAGSLIETPAYAVAAPLIAGGDAQPLLGKNVGHYQIISLVGKGGMGEVYRARDTKLDRIVALKILPEEMSANVERMRRFSREAKAASALNHPNVAHIYEIGEVAGVSFIAMEYVEGQTLAAKINGQPLEASEIVEIGSQIADALDEAHGKGITHRDIKPANVMLNERGQVKVLDFGLAKITQFSAQAVASDISTMAKTAPGVVMGTVPYMSPEQALGREVDHRSDLFSLGVVFYEMATGRLPFAGTSTSEILDRLLHAQPEAMARFNYDVPAELERIVRKCLEKDRERRYQSARELLVDLKNLKRESESTGRSAVKAEDGTSKVKPYWRGALIALAAVALFGMGLYYFVLRSPSPPKVTASAQITRDGLPKFHAPFLFSINPLVTDGSRIYFSRRVNEQPGIAQVSSTGGEAVAISASFPNSVSYYLHDISSIRSELLISRDGELWALPVLGGTPRRLNNLRSRSAAWSLDGRQIVYAGDNALYLANSDGTESRQFVTVTGNPYWPRWSPDGSRLRFTVRDNLTASDSLWEVAADGSNLHPLLPEWNSPAAECCGNWTADGQFFVFQSTRNRMTNIWALREQAGFFQQASQAPVQLTFGPLNYYGPLPSQDGKKLFVVGGLQRGELARYDLKTQQWATYLPGLSAEHLDFSKDGQWVAYVTYPEGDLWRSRIDGRERQQLSFPPMRAALPRWSPDGKQIAFSASLPGKPWKIYLISGEGGPPQQQTPEEGLLAERRKEIRTNIGNERDPGWSPDGKTLLFADGGIYLLDLGTRRLSRLPDPGWYSPRWSPDGRYIAALSQRNNFLLFDFTTQEWTELVEPQVAWLRWSRDGKWIYFASYRADDRALLRIRIADRKIERLASLKDFRMAAGVWGPWPGWTPDDSPLVLRDLGSQDIYALEWRTP
jgi:serine/threonine protein kinase/Tol biopolymer transport system component